MRYRPNEIEPKWQKIWESEDIFRTPHSLEELQQKPKYYALDMFPYPSGAGLHVGHPEGYTATDVVARYKRMNGYNVLHAMGWDAFGLPAERAAMREGIHPAIITKRNIDNFRGQIKRLGFFYDWSREISTSDESFYRWTQWIFLKLYEKGLAYLADVNVNWCPALKTVLANEEVKDGKYVETGDPVEKRQMRQWMLKITAYAQRLLDDLDELDWPESIKEMQRNWIGKSEGALIDFVVADSHEKITVFTTRADTIFGVSFLVVAPEYPLVPKLVTESQMASCVRYIEESKKSSEASRLDATKEKTGVFSGSYVINPITNQKVPVFLADYVLPNYGTGAVMGVPSNDERDAEFATKYQLPFIEITGDGKAINSDFINGFTEGEALKKIYEVIEAKGVGSRKTQFKLRDWLFSRQRYWGEPFPIVYDKDGQPHAIDEHDLPVLLPQIDEYKPTEDGQPPLARASDQWRQVVLSDKSVGLREVNTMPQWAGSCWYYLRYLDPTNNEAPFGKDLEKYWMPVDLYIGGVEHAVLHLLYSRFWHKVLYDCGVVSTKEPFHKLFNQGMILAQSYQDDQGKYYHPDEVYEKDGGFYSKVGDKRLATQVEKMSKSRSNVVNPDDVIDEYGADAMRLYELFMGPLEQVKPWSMAGVDGVYRFLGRVWRLAVDEETGGIASRLRLLQEEEDIKLTKSLHKTIKKVSSDIEALRFNTAIAQMMTFVNEATALQAISRPSLEAFLHLLSPFAPHICDELFNRLGGEQPLLESKWPQFDERLVVEDTVDLVCQVDGKRRANIEIPKDLGNQEIEALVLNNEDIKRFIEGHAIAKIVVVPHRIVNVVLKK